MAYRAVLFDLDGTLLNTLQDLANSMNSVLERSHFPVHDLEAYKYFVGDGIEMLVRRALPAAERDREATFTACLEAMREEYSRRSQEHTRPYEGVPELLDSLTRLGIRLAILSNKPHDATLKVVAELLPRWHFEVVFGERRLIPKKPDPAGAMEIAQSFGIPPAEFLYVGDTAVDMMTAKAAGMFAVGALWGFRKAEELTAAGARVLIGHPGNLLEILAL
jgi:phosphoglycolate phosphatase